MRAQEFIVERDEWMHMDPPEVAQWRDQARVQDIKSGPESTFAASQPTKTGPRYTVPDTPWASSKPAVDTKKSIDPKKTYTNAQRDEYWAAAPKSRGGKVPVRDLTGIPTRDVELDAGKSKNIDWFEPKEQPTKNKSNPLLPSIEKEKYRT